MCGVACMSIAKTPQIYYTFNFELVFDCCTCRDFLVAQYFATPCNQFCVSIHIYALAHLLRPGGFMKSALNVPF